MDEKFQTISVIKELYRQMMEAYYHTLYMNRHIQDGEKKHSPLTFNNRYMGYSLAIARSKLPEGKAIKDVLKDLSHWCNDNFVVISKDQDSFWHLTLYNQQPSPTMLTGELVMHHGWSDYFDDEYSGCERPDSEVIIDITSPTNMDIDYFRIQISDYYVISPWFMAKMRDLIKQILLIYGIENASVEEVLITKEVAKVAELFSGIKPLQSFPEFVLENLEKSDEVKTFLRDYATMVEIRLLYESLVLRQIQPPHRARNDAIQRLQPVSISAFKELGIPLEEKQNA